MVDDPWDSVDGKSSWSLDDTMTKRTGVQILGKLFGDV